MGTKRVGMARVKSLINENLNEMYLRKPKFRKFTETAELLASESGQTILCGPLAAGLASDATLTLPEAEQGLSFRIIYVGGAADTHDLIIRTGSDDNFFIGGLVQHDPTNGGDDTVTYHPNNSSHSKVTILTPDSGTEVECWCDGTNWFIAGRVISATATAVTFENTGG